MKISLNIEKKHFYSILSILVVLGSISFAIASFHNPGHDGNQIEVVYDSQSMSLNSALDMITGAVTGTLSSLNVVESVCTNVGNNCNSDCECIATCGSGQKVIGGGGWLSFSGSGPDTQVSCGIVANGPFGENAWVFAAADKDTCHGGVSSQTQVDVYTYAICVNS